MDYFSRISGTLDGRLRVTIRFQEMMRFFTQGCGETVNRCELKPWAASRFDILIVTVCKAGPLR